MTLIEYHRKLASLMSSDAPTAKKEKAIAELREKFNPTSKQQSIHAQIEEASADYSDIGGHDV